MLAILGLIAGSFVTPARATAVGSTAMTMADDMPCCPDKTAPNCAKGCPLAIMCFAASLPAAAISAVAAPNIARLDVLSPLDDAFIAGVGGAPPRRPPRV
ncbi:hypothetical protein [Methylocystis suflitae]|uniref:hypothetical protein n=1 Tax=Methylocystis suflitae TaxID=2951405 RepID=UPI00210D179E|nr:hypothetical protein [Methylocystis suflitae]MCQ4191076.1 hypothetical protein [Methylocystis suflitae]